YWMSWFAPSLGFITRRMKKHCKVISILDNVIPHERHFFDAPLTKYFLSGSHGSITLCDAVSKDLLELKPDAAYTVIQHPLYTHFGAKKDRYATEQALGLEHGKKTILFFGLIRHYKGLDILLEAFKSLPDDYQLVIAGEPYGSFKTYQDIIDASGCKERVHLFLKYIKDSQVADYFSVSDLAVLPYRSATQSGISSIAYHFEVPMVVTDVGGLKETIGNRGTGLVCKEVSAQSVAKEILRFFADPSLRESCVENIRSEKIRLSWANFSRKLHDFINSLPSYEK
ncbi:MAG: glycosyltransferase, partial [Bacteroidales bacterium]|nr:glycosyltransferase [Bacteroidales bacterium]